MPDVAQGDYEELAQHFGNLEQYRMSDEDMAKFEELRNTEGFWAKVGGVLQNPRHDGRRRPRLVHDGVLRFDR